MRWNKNSGKQQQQKQQQRWQQQWLNDEREVEGVEQDGGKNESIERVLCENKS